MEDSNNIRQRLSWRSKIAMISFLVLMFSITGEMAVRAFWHIQDVPFRDPGLILYAYYPELRKIDAEIPAHSDEFYDILLLGGSVLDIRWGAVPHELLEQLAYAGHRKVRIYNLAVEAHTSRDSFLKYASLGEARFEMVIFYHGINEARANNAPQQIFREDYGHYAWYEIVNALAPYHRTSSLALPYTIRYLSIRMGQILNKDDYVPTHSPRPEWVQYGRTCRSAVSFERNLGAILALASQRNDRILLMTFATYVPENYSLDAFKDKRLDYLLHSGALEVWGERENVVRAVATHNEIVRSLSTQHEVFFVDQASLMKGSSRSFNDPCHFTTFGSARFVQHLLEVLLPTLKTGTGP